MLIVTSLYLGLVYLLFFKFKVLPWNKWSQGLVVLVGTIILTGFLVSLQGLTPSSTQATITGRIVEIAPQVSGPVTSVQVQSNEVVDEGAVLFTVDPLFYQARVDELEATLQLAQLRLEQFAELAEARAGSEFQLQQTEAEVKQVTAQLNNARNDLFHTSVRAPARGMVPRLFLQPGMQVSPSRAVMTFIDTEDLIIVATVQQKSLQNIRLGDMAMVNFPALPGQVFEATVVGLPHAIGEAQALASGQLPVVGQARMTREYPIYVSIPEEFPAELRKIGLAASVTVHTEGAGVVGMVAVILQWVSTSMDAII